MIAKQEQMANKADSSAQLARQSPVANLQPYLMKIKTAGNIELRLILPKLHLATLIYYRSSTIIRM